MKVLYFTKYTKYGASSRLRSFQYFPLLEKEGIEIIVSPFFDDAYLNKLYNKQKQHPFIILKYYCIRFYMLFSVFKYDKVVIEKELFPFFFSWFEKLFNFLNVDYIVDYDDAIFHNYDLNKNKLIRFFLKNKIDNVMRYSNTVVAGNSYLAQRAINAKAKRVVIIPTVIDINNYEIKSNYKSEQLIIGWIGSPTTFKYVGNIFPVLDKLIEKYDCKVHIVGAKPVACVSNNIEFIPWNVETEVFNIKNFDIGIMPLDNTSWELGKCSYKLIQYMGCAIPVVASPVGMNAEVVNDGVNGFLVRNHEEWFLGIEKLILDSKMRKEFGEKGRKKVENSYSLTKASDSLLKVLKL